MSIQIKVFYKGKSPVDKSYREVEQAKYAFDGYKLDYMNINVDLTKQQDFEALINFLEMHKYCFWKPEQPTKITLDKKP